jgi:hypothetical protein
MIHLEDMGHCDDDQLMVKGERGEYLNSRKLKRYITFKRVIGHLFTFE